MKLSMWLYTEKFSHYNYVFIMTSNRETFTGCIKWNFFVAIHRRISVKKNPESLREYLVVSSRSGESLKCWKLQLMLMMSKMPSLKLLQHPANQSLGQYFWLCGLCFIYIVWELGHQRSLNCQPLRQTAAVNGIKWQVLQTCKRCLFGHCMLQINL